LNEYALDDSFDKPKEEAILKEMSEIERRDKMIEELQGQVAQLTTQVEDFTKKTEELETTLNERNSDVEQKASTLGERDNKISELTKENEEQREKIKELEEKNEKQKETFKNFKKDVTEQLNLIETMMKKDMSQINKIGNDGGEEQSGEENEGEASGEGLNLENLADGNLTDTYKKVESYVKRLLEELKKSKEQNYIYKSQIAQNDKINAILNEKIYQYSENACKESNIVASKSKTNSKTDLSKKKKFVPS